MTPKWTQLTGGRTELVDSRGRIHRLTDDLPNGWLLTTWSPVTRTWSKPVRRARFRDVKRLAENRARSHD